MKNAIKNQKSSKGVNETMKKITKFLYNKKEDFLFKTTNPRIDLTEKFKPPKRRFSMQSEHNNTGSKTQILKLPKQPFGKHLNYSTEAEFTKTHFISLKEEVDPSTLNELEEVARQFRLGNRGGTIKPKKRYKVTKRDDNQIFKMKAGLLVCKKQHKITQIYDNSKIEYLQNIASNCNKSPIFRPASRYAKKFNRPLSSNS